MDEDHGAGAGGGLLLGEVNMKQIIRERKAERRQEAESQRQLDLQRIRDMRSTSGIHPLELFPKEIWMMIIDELDPKDIGNLWQVHPFFRRNLMEKDSQVYGVLFPQALHVKTLRRMMHDKQEQLYGVSKAMRNSFDSSDLMKYIHEENSEESDFQYRLLKFDLDSFEQEGILEALLASIHGENYARRFPPRILYVNFFDFEQPTLEIVNQFKNKITTLLETFGDQIWCFEFHMNNLELEEFRFTQAYCVLHEWVSLMPNLKFLKVNVDIFSSDDQQNLKEEEAVALRILREKPFPRLDSLRKVQFIQRERKNIIMLEMYVAILVANQQITILDLDSSDDIVSIFPSLPDPVIKSLQLTNFQLFCKLSSLNEIQRIVNFNWQLDTISLTLAECAGESLDSMFAFLERFPTLENVSLELLRGFKIGDRNRPRFLNLPNLNELKIVFSEPNIDYRCNIHFFFSLQFLLHCKKLKTLKWFILYFNDRKLRNHLIERERPSRMVDFRAGSRYLYDSNIWDVFPRLDTVHVKLWKKSIADEMGCEQEYLRKIKREGVSVGDFLKSHECSRHDCLKDCAMLFG